MAQHIPGNPRHITCGGSRARAIGHRSEDLKLAHGLGPAGERPPRNPAEWSSVTPGQWRSGVCNGSFTGLPLSEVEPRGRRSEFQGPSTVYSRVGGDPAVELYEGSRESRMAVQEPDPRMRVVPVEVHYTGPPPARTQWVPRTPEALGDALCAAATCGDVARMGQLVGMGASVRFYQGDRSSTPLMYACAAPEERLDAVRWLVERCAALDEANEDGWSPLKLAACRGHVGVVEYLVRLGAPVDTTYHQGRTAAMCAAAGPPGGRGSDPAHHNARLGAFPSLFQHPAPPNAPTAQVRDRRLKDAPHPGGCWGPPDAGGGACEPPPGRSVLAHAGKAGGGADGARARERGKCAYGGGGGGGREGEEEKRARVVEVLARHGADLGRTTRHGLNAFMLACQSGQEAVVQALARLGAAGSEPGDIDKPDSDGMTALMLAADQGRSAAVDELLARGADPDKQRDGDGASALILAAMGRHVATCRSLLRAGAKLNVRTMPGGRTAQIIASERGYDDVLAVLDPHISLGEDIRRKALRPEPEPFKDLQGNWLPPQGRKGWLHQMRERVAEMPTRQYHMPGAPPPKNGEKFHLSRPTAPFAEHY